MDKPKKRKFRNKREIEDLLQRIHEEMKKEDIGSTRYSQLNYHREKLEKDLLELKKINSGNAQGWAKLGTGLTVFATSIVMDNKGILIRDTPKLIRNFLMRGL